MAIMLPHRAAGPLSCSEKLDNRTGYLNKNYLLNFYFIFSINSDSDIATRARSSEKFSFLKEQVSNVLVLSRDHAWDTVVCLYGICY